MPTEPTAEANKEFVRRYFEEFVNRKNAAVIRRNMTPGFLDHDEPGGRPAGVEADKVMCWAQWHGTDAQTGRKMEFHGFVLWRLAGGLIAERWATVTPPKEV